MGGDEARLALVRADVARQPAAPGGVGDVAGLLRRVCAAAAERIQAFGVGIWVMSADGVPGFSVASDPVVEQIEDLQLTIGEGASAEAFSSRRPVLVPDLTEHLAPRWPIYSAAMNDCGIRAVFAFPIQAGASRLGVFNIFRARPGVLVGDELALALTFSEVALITLLDGHDASTDWLAGAMRHQAAVFQAQGMVMVQLGVSLEEALIRLRARAYADGRPLTELAQDVLARTLRFERGHREPEIFDS